MARLAHLKLGGTTSLNPEGGAGAWTGTLNSGFARLGRRRERFLWGRRAPVPVRPD